MAFSDFGPESYALAINGRNITQWGETDPPATDEPIDQKSTLRRGLGGGAVRLDRSNPGRRVTINLNPGGSDSAFLQGLMNSRANIEMGYTVIGSGEVAVGAEGVIVNDGSNGRAGTTISDDQYIIEFNIWSQTKGGV